MLVRDLDNIYFRVERDGVWQNFCFTDLTYEETDEVIKGRADAWFIKVCEILLDVLNGIKTAVNRQEMDNAVVQLLNSLDKLPPKDRALKLKAIVRNFADYYDIVGS